MHKHFCAIALLLMSVTHADNNEATYEDLARKASAGDLSIDFQALRFACLKAKSCDAEGDRKQLLAGRKAMHEKDYANAAKIAEGMIAKGFPNIEAQALAANAYAALNDGEKAKFHHDVTSALIQSILKSGDGKSKETAFAVINVHEEYIVMSVLGLSPMGSQSLITGKPHSYDLLERDEPKSGTKVSVYFLIDAFFPMKL
jgi:hypothetical protein